MRLPLQGLWREASTGFGAPEGGEEEKREAGEGRNGHGKDTDDSWADWDTSVNAKYIKFDKSGIGSSEATYKGVQCRKLGCLLQQQ